VTRPRGAKILVVEDDSMVRELVEDTLTDAGHRVLTADDPTMALQIASDSSIELDLIVTDIVMPGMRGNELRARIADSRPGIRAIYMSGYADDMVLSESDLDGPDRVRFLQKPFAIDDLLRAIEDAMAD
jgi:two-component system cell cycle sensor histidine kinase/response regulator CckA